MGRRQESSYLRGRSKLQLRTSTPLPLRTTSDWQATKLRCGASGASGSEGFMEKILKALEFTVRSGERAIKDSRRWDAET